MLDLLTAAPKDIRFGDRVLKIGALKIKELGQLQRWVRDHDIRPTARVKALADVFDAAEYRDQMKRAVIEERDWPPAVGTYLGNQILFSSLEGQEFFLRIFLGKYQEISDELIDQITSGLSEEDFGVLVSIAFGEDDLDPESVRAAARAAIAAAMEAAQEQIDAGTESTGESSSSTSHETLLTGPPPSSESSPSPSS